MVVVNSTEFLLYLLIKDHSRKCLNTLYFILMTQINSSVNTLLEFLRFGLVLVHIQHPTLFVILHSFTQTPLTLFIKVLLIVVLKILVYIHYDKLDVLLHYNSRNNFVLF